VGTTLLLGVVVHARRTEFISARLSSCWLSGPVSRKQRKIDRLLTSIGINAARGETGEED
jgi:hypothetical protein